MIPSPRHHTATPPPPLPTPPQQPHPYFPTHLLLCLFLLVFLHHHQACPPPTQNLTVGFLLPTSGLYRVRKSVLEHLTQSLFKEANEMCWVPGYHLSYVIADSGCDEGKTLDGYLKLHAEDNVSFFIGPICETSCSHIGPLLSEWQSVSVTFGCRSKQLHELYIERPLDLNISYSDEGHRELQRHNISVQTSGIFADLATFVLAVVRSFSWYKGYLIVFTETSSSSVSLDMDLPYLTKVMKIRDIAVRHVTVSLDMVSLKNQMAALVTKSFVFVLAVYPETAWRLLRMLKNLDYFTKGLVYIVFDFANLCLRFKGCTKTDDFTGLLDITAAVTYNSNAYMEFLNKIPYDTSVYRLGQCQHKNYELGIVASQIHDAISLLFEGFRYAVTRFGSTNISRAKFVHVLTDEKLAAFREKYLLYEGTIDAPKFMLNNLVNGCYFPIGISVGQTATGMGYMEINSTVVYPGGTTVKPNCPRRYCTNTTDIIIVLVCYISVLVVVLGVLIILAYKRRSIICDLGRKDWIISSEIMYSVEGRSRTTSPTKGVPGMKAPWKRDDAQIIDQNQDSMRTIAMGQIFTKVTVLEQQLVAIKSINKSRLVLTNDIFTEVNQIRSLRHTNVNNLIGACVEPGNICLVWGYGAKGSLRDVLSNDTFRLDWMFKISFISDIAKGMAYIHNSPVGVHGRLKSKNVIVDTNWTCKITDFAMLHFRSGEENISDDLLRAYSLLWTAPEILRLYEFPMRATKKGDVYAFAIIMHEILTREEPFGVVNASEPAKVLMRVMNEEKPPYRPSLPSAEPDLSQGKLSDYGEVLDLMIMCWDEYPLFRLPFTTVSYNLKKIRQSAGTARNLADEMLAQMTKYADLLEQQVEDRTLQIQDEQEKAEELLGRMLPKSVTRELKLGNMVIPEYFQSVTIFFSDIVGFTALAAKSTPLQVVTLLNDLYTIFDNIVDDYDAYKIETIGDAYMVVSGLPVRNGDRHAAEIASAALRILTCILGFRIRHCPDQHLLLRIGLHTGPVVAGVVGIKMPRYCLFGDTVTCAARMESSGKPLHIHISHECKIYLDKIGGFQTVERGTVQKTGGGQMKTYFLMGKVGLQVVVPKLPPDVLAIVGISISHMEEDLSTWTEISMTAEDLAKRRQSRVYSTLINSIRKSKQTDERKMTVPLVSLPKSTSSNVSTKSSRSLEIGIIHSKTDNSWY